ncbi:MAG: O-antigen ligase family protein [Gammaproteobacteria bacterium]|nr:O-antigen ligase family protein [Gammaproteobacteria bacterium]
MSDFRLEPYGVQESEPETPKSEVTEPVKWGGPALRSTLWFLAAPACFAVAIMLFHLKLPSFVLYGFAGVFGLALFKRCLQDPEWLLAVFAIYIPLNRIYVVPIVPGINGTNLLLLLLLFCWLIRAIREDRSLFTSMPNTKLVGLWAVISSISVVTSLLTLGFSRASDHFGDFKAWIDQFIVFYAFLNLIRDGRMARRVVVYMMLGTLVVILFGIQEAIEKEGLASIEKSRLLGPQMQPNDFGAFLVYNAGPFLALFVVYFRRIRAWPLFLYLATMAKLLIMTFSRGAYIGMALAGLAAGYLRGKLFLLFWALVAVGVLAAMPQLIPASIVDRMAQTKDSSGAHGEMDASSEHRLVLWKAAIEMTLESPILGKGFKAFPAFKDQYTEYYVREADNHNMYLYICSQMGIPALVIFLLLLIKMYRLGGRLYRKGTEPFMRIIGMGAAAMVVAVLAINMFGSRMVSIEVDGYFWIMLAVLAHLWVEHEQTMEANNVSTS